MIECGYLTNLFILQHYNLIVMSYYEMRQRFDLIHKKRSSSLDYIDFHAMQGFNFADELNYVYNKSYRKAIKIKRKDGRIRYRDHVRISRHGMIYINGKYSNSTTEIFLNCYEKDLDRFIRRVTQSMKEEQKSNKKGIWDIIRNIF